MNSGMKIMERRYGVDKLNLEEELMKINKMKRIMQELKIQYSDILRTRTIDNSLKSWFSARRTSLLRGNLEDEEVEFYKNNDFNFGIKLLLWKDWCNLLKEKILKINKKEVIETLKIDQYTLDDIIDCLIKPNRSIRDQYQTPLLKKDILHIEDLKPGMVLEGTVRNVVDFGAFVDIGLKNDGLVHISKMSKQRIKHPLDVLSIGDIVEVNVIDVDLNKKRVSLSMI